MHELFEIDTIRPNSFIVILGDENNKTELQCHIENKLNKRFSHTHTLLEDYKSASDGEELISVRDFLPVNVDDARNIYYNIQQNNVSLMLSMRVDEAIPIYLFGNADYIFVFKNMERLQNIYKKYFSFMYEDEFNVLMSDLCSNDCIVLDQTKRCVLLYKM